MRKYKYFSIFVLTVILLLSLILVNCDILGDDIETIRERARNKNHIPVKDITGVPTLITAGVPLALEGNVEPQNATNKDIVFSVHEAGDTGAVIDGNVFIAPNAGTVTVRVTIKNGRTATTPFVKDFNVTVSARAEITNAAITGVAAPVRGAAPSTASDGTGNFNRSDVTWSPDHNPFQGVTVYTASITLTANSGYTFTGLETATINGGSANILANTGETVMLTREFPETERTPITTAAITDVVAPETNAAPNTASAGTGNFTGGNVTWSPNHNPFQGSTVYTASITLTANSGYTFTGLETATINGSHANIGANTDSTVTLTQEFPATAPAAINSSTGIDLLYIPSGSFTMGSPESEANRESGETQHQVTISKGFYMGKYEVTQEQYQAVTGVNPSYFSSNPASGEVQSKRPIENITWYDAVEFCNKLSAMEGLTSVYTITGRTPASGYPISSATVTADWNASGYRLPTEAEWEYACRAGTTTAYNTGDTISDNTGWYNSNSSSITHEVGKKPPNAWGLYDMHGNVWEWCWDWYGTYASGAQTDPRGAVSGSARVQRGGSWSYAGQNHRSALRFSNSPGGRLSAFGFRLVRL